MSESFYEMRETARIHAQLSSCHCSICERVWSEEQAKRKDDEITRLRAIEAAAREVSQRGGTVVTEYRREFAPGDLPDVDELDAALVELRKALEGGPTRE